MNERVSLRDIYAAITELRKEVTERVDKIDDRVRALERRAAWAAGVLALYAFLTQGAPALARALAAAP